LKDANPSNANGLPNRPNQRQPDFNEWS
jgi:hypothetical protein